MIKDIIDYNKRMARTTNDKLDYVFDFLDEHSDIQAIVDYGCADGTLTAEIKKNYPHLLVIGYDYSDAMIALAESKRYTDIIFTTDVRLIEELCSGLVVAVNFSSVLHEVCSFHYENYVHHIIEALHAEYIFIRDMMWHCDPFCEKHTVITEDICDTALAKSYEEKRGVDLKNAPAQNQVEYAIKIQYPHNWENELAEDYFAFTEFKRRKIFENFMIVERTFYTLPYVKQWLSLYIDSEGKYTTHTKIILERAF